MCQKYNQKYIIMNTITVSNFRKNMAAAFNKAAEGEDVMVRRGTQLFAIIPIQENDITINKDNLVESLRKSLIEVKNAKEGKGKLLTWEEFQHEMER